MIVISFFVADKEGEVARRHWPAVPIIGSSVFLHELMGVMRVVEVEYGDYTIGDEPIAGELVVVCRGTLVDDEAPDTQEAPIRLFGLAGAPSAEAPIVVVAPGLVSKLATARAALYDTKFALEQHALPDPPELDSTIRAIINALDATTDEAADQEHEARKKIAELEAEVLSLKQQLARAHHAAGRG